MKVGLLSSNKQEKYMNSKKLIAGVLVLIGVISFGLAMTNPVRADEDHGSQMRDAHAIGSTLEVHIYDSGKVLVRGAKVTSVNGTTVNATTTWGSAVVNWAVQTNASTQFVRRSGGTSSASEISVGDFVSFNGNLLTTTGSPLTVQATTLKDWSIQKAHATFNGTISSVNATNQTFVLASEDRGNVTVQTTSATKIMLGNDISSFAGAVKVGMKVTAGGLYDSASRIVTADQVIVHPADSTRTTLEGKVKSIPAGALPTTFVLTSNGADYTIRAGVDTSILNVLWLRMPIGSIRAGDTVRVYGTINPGYTVDATVVRDTSIRI
jgi:hypothetical protein